MCQPIHEGGPAGPPLINRVLGAVKIKYVFGQISADAGHLLPVEPMTPSPNGRWVLRYSDWPWQLRNCPAPGAPAGAPRVLDIFNDVKRHHLNSGDHVVQTFQPQLTQLQQQVLELLHIPASIYT
jgi:hypothetical protein